MITKASQSAAKEPVARPYFAAIPVSSRNRLYLAAS
jgi:hypothetical protein